MTHRRLFAFVLTATLTGTLVMAPLQAEQPTQEEMDAQAAAIASLKEGVAHFANQDFGKAIVAFRSSYEAYPTGIAQFNLAESYIKQAQNVLELELLDRAEEALNRAVSNEPKVPLDEAQYGRVKEFRDEIARLRQEIPCQRALKDYEEATQLWRTQRQSCQESASTRRLDHTGKVGAAVSGAGAVTLLTSAFFAVRARAQLDALEPPYTQGRAQYDADVATLHTTQRRGRGTLYVGSGLFALGGGLLVADLLSTEQVYSQEGCEAILEKPAPAYPSACKQTQAYWPTPPTPSQATGRSSLEWSVGPTQLTARFYF